ncbi:MAG: hypothetical protein LBF09_07205, partial [Odoribacteraceae bacterium]|nr:hypothetical protein [Odoribacteraceae bacterium]
MYRFAATIPKARQARDAGTTAPASCRDFPGNNRYPTPLGWPTTKLGWPTTMLGWPTTKLGWPTTKLGWPTTKPGWPTTKLGWPTTKLDWPTTMPGYFNFSRILSIRGVDAHALFRQGIQHEGTVIRRLIVGERIHVDSLQVGRQI